jgi:hypothetical protein
MTENHTPCNDCIYRETEKIRCDLENLLQKYHENREDRMKPLIEYLARTYHSLTGEKYVYRGKNEQT